MRSVSVEMDAARNHAPVASSLPVVLYENKTSGIDLPTVDEINALPEKFRQYLHDLETRCDKSGDVQTIAILREDRDALQQRVQELEARIARQEREYLEAPIETD
jgi:hypothetical protein